MHLCRPSSRDESPPSVAHDNNKNNNRVRYYNIIGDEREEGVSGRWKRRRPESRVLGENSPTGDRRMWVTGRNTDAFAASRPARGLAGRGRVRATAPAVPAVPRRHAHRPQSPATPPAPWPADSNRRHAVWTARGTRTHRSGVRRSIT